MSRELSRRLAELRRRAEALPDPPPRADAVPPLTPAIIEAVLAGHLPAELEAYRGIFEDLLPYQKAIGMLRAGKLGFYPGS